jgi:hypothetical protein
MNTTIVKPHMYAYGWRVGDHRFRVDGFLL